MRLVQSVGLLIGVAGAVYVFAPWGLIHAVGWWALLLLVWPALIGLGASRHS